MAQIKSYTNFSQSKKLAEILPLESADMVYLYWINSRTKKEGVDTIPTIREELPIQNCDIPCWSLAALLELIPPYLGEFSEGVDFGFGKAMNGKWYSAHYLQYIKEDIKPVKVITGETAIDVVFEMICWLKENKKI